jgi:hypothetical protein
LSERCGSRHRCRRCHHHTRYVCRSDHDWPGRGQRREGVGGQLC